MFVYREVHGYDESRVEVCENVPVDVENGGMILEENEGEAVGQE